MRDIESLRDPRYTGPERCWPCTVVNIVILGLLVAWLATRRRLLGAVLATAGLAAIYLRGYFVPYTPRFAPALVAASPLPDEWFHDDPLGEPASDAGSLAESIDLDGEAVLREFLAAEIVEDDGETLFLAPDVESAWHDRMADLASPPPDVLATELAAALDHVTDPEAVEIEGREYVRIGPDPTDIVARPVAIAELAAYRTLETVDDESLRLAGAELFRMFLDACPDCGTALVESSELDCCGGHSNFRETPSETLACPTCEQRLYTFPAED